MFTLEYNPQKSKYNLIYKKNLTKLEAENLFGGGPIGMINSADYTEEEWAKINREVEIMQFNKN